MPQFLAMFPGQGSQFVGMGQQLLTEFPKTKTIFEEAEDAIKAPVRRLCLEGPEDELKLTANTQPCILAVSYAMWTVLREETGIEPHLFAGHSLGEYSAVVAAGKIDFARAVLLVRRRGEAMQAAVPVGVGAMAAVLNMAADALQVICARVSKDDQSCEVVNFNSPQQLVIAGHKAAVEQVAREAEVQSAKAVMLPVSAPFHSRLMRKAREQMTPLLNETKIHDNARQVVANLTGEVAQPYTAEMLIKQIDSPVRWTQSLETAVSQGCDGFIEIGPGKVLFGLARRSVSKSAKLLHTDDIVKTIGDIKA